MLGPLQSTAEQGLSPERLPLSQLLDVDPNDREEDGANIDLGLPEEGQWGHQTHTQGWGWLKREAEAGGKRGQDLGLSLRAATEAAPGILLHYFCPVITWWMGC